MSTPTAPQHPTNDSKAASIAWAVAAIVVALVIAFIAWLALGGQGSDDAAGDSSTATQDVPAQPAEDQTADAPGSQATDGTEDQAQPPAQEPGPDAAEQTPSPEIEEFMLGLQRRDAEDPMAVGDVDAPVVMIEYADYRCPFCAQYHRETRPELAPLVEDGTLRIEFRDLVIFDENSMMAALGGRAAAEQGLLEEYQQEVFALSDQGHGEYDQDDLIEVAEQIGVEDLDAFEAAFDDPEILAAVQADTAEAKGIGVTSTPTFLINTQVVQGAYPIQHFRQVISAEAEKVEEDAR